MEKIWLQPPLKGSAPIEVEYVLEKIKPLMVAGHRQCDPPEPGSTSAPDPVKSTLAPTPSTANVTTHPSGGAKPEPLPALDEYHAE